MNMFNIIIMVVIMNTPKWHGTIRTLLMLAAGFAVAIGWADETWTSEAVAAVLTLITVIWSYRAPEKSGALALGLVGLANPKWLGVVRAVLGLIAGIVIQVGWAEPEWATTGVGVVIGLITWIFSYTAPEKQINQVEYLSLTKR